MQKIFQGVRRFQTDLFADQRELFEGLARKPQSPLALFITCSDSRINPNLITQTEPGELFILRNAGNIIPPYGSANGGEGATVEYAVSVLGLKDIIVCGHWHCGAMHSLISSEGLGDLPAVRKWFSHAEATRRILRGPAYQSLPAEELAVRAAEQNVLVQIGNLHTHPGVAAGLARGEIRIHAWVYRIETGEIFAYDAELRGFVSLAESATRPLPHSPILATLPTLGVS
jgi:carbonic anhydrase